MSRWSDIGSGVPQGSVLGPVLFCLRLDGLSPICSNTMYIKYADDVSVLDFVRQSSEDCLQTELDHIVRWSSSMCLPINFSKFKVMNMSPAKIYLCLILFCLVVASLQLLSLCVLSA